MRLTDPDPDPDRLPGVSGDTQIRTPCGLRRADLLRPGDLCVTRDNGLRPLRLVLRLSLAAAVAADPDAAAIRLAPRAVGPMMPARTAALGPGQPVLLPAYLLGADLDAPAAFVPAAALARGTDAAWRDRTQDDRPLYALAFDRHEVISAAGLWIGSYRPEAARLDRLDRDARADLLRVFPALAERRDPFPAAPYAALSPQAYLPTPA